MRLPKRNVLLVSGAATAPAVGRRGCRSVRKATPSRVPPAREAHMDDLWERVRGGKHTAVLGTSPGDPPPALGIRLVRVRCDVPPSTLGPLHDARQKVEHLLGNHPPLLDQARFRMVSGLRRRLLGDVPALESESALVEVWNRLASSSDRPAALLFEAVDATDDATLATLRRIVGRPGWLKLPLVLVFRSAEPDGGAAGLLGALRLTAGDDCVIRAAPQVGSARSAPALDFRTLPHDVLRVLRAGALVGSGFEADLVGALLEMDVLDVLGLVQRAADAGVPIEDRGEARFHLPEPLLDALRASMLPSLMIAQHRRLAELLGGFDEEEREDFVGEEEEEAPPPPVEPRPRPQEAVESPATEPAGFTRHVRVTPTPVPPPVTKGETPRPAPASAAAPATEESERHLPGVWPYAEIFGGAPPAAVEAHPPEPLQVAFKETLPRELVHEASAAKVPPSVGPRSLGGSRVDDARAAGHLAAAGEHDASAERYFAAAQKAGASGAYTQALALADKALGTLESLPESPRRRRLRAGVLLEVGRLRWVTSTPDAEFTLSGAIEVLDAARASLTADDPVELKASAATLIAAVCYDVGDAAALARALDELTAASRLLLDAGDATGAARLLNDQAAVYVRMGDPVRATHLLSESRRIFEARAATDPVAMVEMAETDHLFARIPLHVPARPGREGDALTMGLDHALAAERAYKKLDARRELARVWETMGRLELRKGRLERARERLVEAVQLEEAIGDLVGLARSTAALSELLAASGRYQEALGVLGDSVSLNFEKGSPIGLAFNRRALDALARSASDAGQAGAALGEVERELAEAESVLGRMKLPGEAD